MGNPAVRWGAVVVVPVIGACLSFSWARASAQAPSPGIDELASVTYRNQPAGGQRAATTPVSFAVPAGPWFRPADAWKQIALLECMAGRNLHLRLGAAAAVRASMAPLATPTASTAVAAAAPIHECVAAAPVPVARVRRPHWAPVRTTTPPSTTSTTSRTTTPSTTSTTA